MGLATTPPNLYKPLGLLMGSLTHRQEAFCFSYLDLGPNKHFPLATRVWSPQQFWTSITSTCGFLNLPNNHSIVIHISCKCQWTANLSHLDKYWGRYACSNLGNPRSHTHATAITERCRVTTLHSKCHISYLTPILEVFLSILESSCHELHIAHGITFFTPSHCGWEVFPTIGALIHFGITWTLSLMTPQVLGFTLESPLCPWCFGHSLWRGVQHTRIRQESISNLWHLSFKMLKNTSIGGVS